MTSPIIVTGADGMLGSAVMRAGIRNGIDVRGLSKADLDITDVTQVVATLKRYGNPMVINCAGIVPDHPRANYPTMMQVNCLPPRLLADHAVRLVQISTDCVFDGKITEGAYLETDEPRPDDDYSKTKLHGEVYDAPHVTIRVSFVGLGQRGLLRWLLNFPRGGEVPGFQNWIWNGWTASTLAAVLLPLATTPDITGLVHMPGPDIVTKGWLLAQVAARLRPDLQVVQQDAPTPRRMVLESEVLALKAPTTTWDRMLDELEEEYHA